MSNCTICAHQEHNGRRCDFPIIERRGVDIKGVIFTEDIPVGTCGCGLVDSLMKYIALEGID